MQAMQDVVSGQEKLVNHSPPARDLQTSRVFFHHPKWVIAPVNNRKYSLLLLKKINLNFLMGLQVLGDHCISVIF